MNSWGDSAYVYSFDQSVIALLTPLRPPTTTTSRSRAWYRKRQAETSMAKSLSDDARRFDFELTMLYCEGRRSTREGGNKSIASEVI